MNIRVIKGFKNYYVSDTGLVFTSEMKQMSLQVNIDGYFVINLKKDGKYYHKRVNRLVAENFIDNPYNLPVVNHIDHDRKNNHVSNLEWVTFKENSRQSIDKYPEKRKQNAIIDKQTAIKICELLSDGLTNKDISDRLNVSITIIKNIRRGNTWKEISKNYSIEKRGKSISESTARWICKMISEGYSNSEIVKKATSKNITRNLVKTIRAKRTWLWLSKEYF